MEPELLYLLGIITYIPVYHMEKYQPPSSVEEAKGQFIEILNGNVAPPEIHKLNTPGEFVQDIAEEIVGALVKVGWEKGTDPIPLLSGVLGNIKDRLRFREIAYLHAGMVRERSTSEAGTDNSDYPRT